MNIRKVQFKNLEQDLLKHGYKYKGGILEDTFKYEKRFAYKGKLLSGECFVTLDFRDWLGKSDRGDYAYFVSGRIVIEKGHKYAIDVKNEGLGFMQMEDALKAFLDNRQEKDD